MEANDLMAKSEFHTLKDQLKISSTVSYEFLFEGIIFSLTCVLFEFPSFLNSPLSPIGLACKATNAREGTGEESS